MLVKEMALIRCSIPDRTSRLLSSSSFFLYLNPLTLSLAVQGWMRSREREDKVYSNGFYIDTCHSLNQTILSLNLILLVRKQTSPPSNSHSGHMGAYLNQPSSDLSFMLAWHTFKKKNTQLPFTLKVHRPPPVCFGTLCQHTHTRSLTCTHKNSTEHEHPPTHTPSLPVHLAGAICSSCFVSARGEAAQRWWCREASWWSCLFRLVEDRCDDRRLN